MAFDSIVLRGSKCLKQNGLNPSQHQLLLASVLVIPTNTMLSMVYWEGFLPSAVSCVALVAFQVLVTNPRFCAVSRNFSVECTSPLVAESGQNDFPRARQAHPASY